MAIDKFQEYKLFVDDTARFSERRQGVSNLYVAVNSIILTAVAFLAKDAPLRLEWRDYTASLVLLAGIVICLQWHRLIKRYKRLIRFRFDQLRAMEDDPAMDGAHKMYHEEDALYPRDAEGQVVKGQGLNIADREMWLPVIFIVVYVAFTVGILAYPIFPGN